MPEKTYTLAEAAKKKKVSRQAMHLFVLRHKDRCQEIGNAGKRTAIILIPESLLKEYTPLTYRQAAGQARGRRKFPSTWK